FNCRGHRTESRAARERERLARLELSGGGSQCGTESSRRSGEVRQVKDVEEFRAEFKVSCFGKRESAVQNQIDLPEIRPAQEVPWQVAERPGFWYFEGSRIEQGGIRVQVRIPSGNEVGPACRARGTAIRRVNHSGSACRGGREDSSGGVGGCDVGPGNE